MGLQELIVLDRSVVLDISEWKKMIFVDGDEFLAHAGDPIFCD